MLTEEQIKLIDDSYHRAFAILTFHLSPKDFAQLIELRCNLEELKRQAAEQQRFTTEGGCEKFLSISSSISDW